MDALKFAAVVFALVLLQVFASIGTPSSGGDDDTDEWIVENWQGFPLERALRLVDLIKRSRAQQFHGLMGRSLGIRVPVSQGRKRNKGEMFVGLMGRRSLGADSDEE
ncbi:tachykinin-4-like [Pholidichthys leucotaenia]